MSDTASARLSASSGSAELAGPAELSDSAEPPGPVESAGPAESAETVAAATDWRARKRAATRRTLQDHAIRLFLEKGYEATTVDEIAAAAGVSHMTFFRYFPTKEDAALADDFDPLLADLIAARPATEPPLDRVRLALLDGLARIPAFDQESLLVRSTLVLTTPALRARLWENQTETQELIARALEGLPPSGRPALRSRVLAAACMAAATTAVVAWVESEGELSLADLIAEAFGVLEGAAGARAGAAD